MWGLLAQSIAKTMATGKVLPSPLEDLPSDVLSAVLFHLSCDDILSLSTASKTIARNVKVAKQIVLQTAQELFKSLSVTGTIVTFINDFEKAIRFAHDARSFAKGVTVEEFCEKLMPLTRSYGYSSPEFVSVPGFPRDGTVRVLTPSKIRIKLKFDGDVKYVRHCIIKSYENLDSSGYLETATYYFSKVLCLKFSYFWVDRLDLPNHDVTHFEVSRYASLREIVQAAKDIGDYIRLYERWGVEDAFTYVDIDLGDRTRYKLKLDGYTIYRYIDDRLDSLFGGNGSERDFKPDAVHSLRFLRFLIQKEWSE